MGGLALGPDYNPSLIEEPPNSAPVTTSPTTNLALPPLPKRDMTGVEAGMLGIASIGDLLAGIGGKSPTGVATVQGAITARQKQALEERKAQIEELDYQRKLRESEQRHQQAFPVTLGNANKEVKELASLALGQTPERTTALRNAARAVYQKSGLDFMGGLVEPLFEREDGTDLLQAFEDLMPHVSFGRGMAILRQANRDAKGEGGLDTIEKNMIDAAAPKLNQELKALVLDTKAIADVTKGKLDYDGLRSIVARQQGPEAPGRLKYFDGAYGKTDLAKGLRGEFDKWLTRQGIEIPDTTAAAQKAEAVKTSEQKAEAPFRISQDLKDELVEAGVRDPSLATDEQIKTARERVKKVADLEGPVRQHLRTSGVKPADATPDQIKSAEKAVQEAEVRRQAAVGENAARIQSEREQNKPLDKDAVFWLNPKTGEAANPEWSLKDAKARGFVPVTQSGLDATATAKASLTLIGEYRKLAPRFLVEGTGNIIRDVAAVQSNRVSLLLKRKGGDPDVKSYDALVGSIATLARATGDTANIAVQERRMLQEMVITDEDTVRSITQKFDQAERILTSIIEARNVPVPKGGSKGETILEYRRDSSGRLVPQRTAVPPKG